MPKPAKARPKAKTKPKLKRKAEPEAPGITTKKSYWVTLLGLLTILSVVFGVMSGLELAETAMLVVTVAVVVGFVGYVRVSASTLSLGKRATFIFAGASVIGFSIWAAVTLAFKPQIAALGSEFLVIASFAICLACGGLIGELLGRNRRVQERLFPQNL